MKRLYHAMILSVCLLSGALLSACAKEEVRDSVSHGLEKSCSLNANHCTLNDGEKVRPDGKGAQR